jgi:hypothetical protein
MNLQDFLGVEYLILEAGSRESNYGVHMTLFSARNWHCDEFPES